MTTTMALFASRSTKNTSDIGLAVLHHLNSNTASAGGPYIDIRAFLDAHVAKHGLTKEAAKDVLWEMAKSGYLGTSNDAILSYPDGFASSHPRNSDEFLWYKLTWKGKAFILEHLKEGVLSRNERIGFWAILVLTLFSTIAALGQLWVSICPCCRP